MTGDLGSVRVRPSWASFLTTNGRPQNGQTDGHDVNDAGRCCGTADRHRRVSSQACSARTGQVCSLNRYGIAMPRRCLSCSFSSGANREHDALLLERTSATSSATSSERRRAPAKPITAARGTANVDSMSPLARPPCCATSVERPGPLLRLGLHLGRDAGVLRQVYRPTTVVRALGGLIPGACGVRLLWPLDAAASVEGFIVRLTSAIYSETVSAVAGRHDRPRAWHQAQNARRSDS